MNALKPCPFCGSTKLKTESKQRLAGWTGIDAQVDSVTYSVRCNACHARGGTAGGRVIKSRLMEYRDRMPEWATTENNLRKAAIEAWNNRSVDVAPVVHGEWLRVSDDDQYEGEYYCSVCNAEEFFPNNAPFAPFCWHCGAKMDGGKHEK